jgi:hypothetical protein
MASLRSDWVRRGIGAEGATARRAVESGKETSGAAGASRH